MRLCATGDSRGCQERQSFRGSICSIIICLTGPVALASIHRRSTRGRLNCRGLVFFGFIGFRFIDRWSDRSRCCGSCTSIGIGPLLNLPIHGHGHDIADSTLLLLKLLNVTNLLVVLMEVLVAVPTVLKSRSGTALLTGEGVVCELLEFQWTTEMRRQLLTHAESVERLDTRHASTYLFI